MDVKVKRNCISIKIGIPNTFMLVPFKERIKIPSSK